jgi:signal transduction histidine kinase
VEVRLEPGDGLLVGAPEPVLSIAVGNLLANALAATSQGWVSIVLEENCLTISDTGPGIELERLDAVTRPYVTGGSGGTAWDWRSSRRSASGSDGGSSSTVGTAREPVPCSASRRYRTTLPPVP